MMRTKRADFVLFEMLVSLARGLTSVRIEGRYSYCFYKTVSGPLKSKVIKGDERGAGNVTNEPGDHCAHVPS